MRTIESVSSPFGHMCPSESTTRDAPIADWPLFVVILQEVGQFEQQNEEIVLRANDAVDRLGIEETE